MIVDSYQKERLCDWVEKTFPLWLTIIIYIVILIPLEQFEALLIVLFFATISIGFAVLFTAPVWVRVL